MSPTQWNSGSASIVRRLVAASIAAVPLFLGVTGYAIDRAHTRSLLEAERSQLQLHFYGILGVMEWSNAQAISVERLREPRFWQFRSGLYAFIHSSNGVLQWRSASANSLEYLRHAFSNTPPGRGIFDTHSARGETYFRYQYHAIWEDENGLEFPLVFTLLKDQTQFETEVMSFRKSIAFWLSIAALLLFTVQLTVLRWGLLPLRRLSHELRELESGKRTALGNEYPPELTGVTRNLNRLLEKEHQQRERYRNTLGDLAHSLKTPLSVMRTVNADKPDPTLAEQLDKMGNIIAYQLQRAVSAGPRKLGHKTPVRPLLTRLLNSLDKVYRDKALHMRQECPSECSLAVDEQDLMELLGNLLDNACKAARSRIEVRVTCDGGEATIDVIDDGPGFPADKAEMLMQRGKRGDQYGAGQGLGLAVVSDIVSSYNASIKVGRPPSGGACVRLLLPA